MARPLWSGSLSFGLVNVPVQLVTAARDLDYHFNELHEKDKARIEQRRFCTEEDEEVTWEEVAHSYDLDGKQVVVTDEELGSVQPRKTRTVEVEAFVELADVDPIFFNHPYFLVPAGESEGTMRAYRLLVDARRSTSRLCGCATAPSPSPRCCSRTRCGPRRLFPPAARSRRRRRWTRRWR
jgi:DNA end-binding protein Ku